MDPGPLEPNSKANINENGIELREKIKVLYDRPRVQRQVLIDLSGIRTAAVSDFAENRNGTYNPQAWFEGATLVSESLDYYGDFANTNGVHFVGKMMPKELVSSWAALDDAIHEHLRGAVRLDVVMKRITELQRAIVIYQAKNKTLTRTPMKLIAALGLAAGTCGYALKFDTQRRPINLGYN
jgi:hypothetical protein